MYELVGVQLKIKNFHEDDNALTAVSCVTFHTNPAN